MNDATDSTHSDDIPAIDSQSEQSLLDAVMRNSPIMDEIAEPPLPEEEGQFDDSAESDEVEDPNESDEVVSEGEEEEVEVTDDEALGEDAPEGATQEPETYTSEDLDLDAKVLVKVDGEELEVSFGDLLKGYQTDAHLSKKGRELGEAQKVLTEEREAKLAELDTIAEASSAMLANTENAYAKQYQQFNQAIEKARANGDAYELGELKDKREQAQERYWKARNQREGLVKQVTEARAEAQQKQFEEQITSFQESIPELIPDFSDDVAMEIRDFALKEGIAEGLLDSVVDPAVVKFIDDYRRLKQGVNKGAVKRKKAPAKKALPTKKSPAPVKKAQQQAQKVRQKALTEDSSQDDQMAFLRQYASKSLNL